MYWLGPQMPVLGWAVLRRSWELNAGLPRGWQEPRTEPSWLLSRVCVSRHREPELGATPSILDVGHRHLNC